MSLKVVEVKSLGNSPYLISLKGCDIIGHGNYAEVLKAFNRNDSSEKLAAKIFKLSEAKKFQSAIRELFIVMNLPIHPNLVQYKKVKITSKNNLYIIMEQCKSSLQKVVDEALEMKENEVWRILFEIVEGYKALYQKKLIHRDIKPENILVGFDGRYKLSDFGLAQVIEGYQKQRKAKGSPIFMAPELFAQKAKVDNLNDVYSLGVTLYYVCFKTYPYIESKKQKITQLIKKVQNSALTIPQNSYSLELIQLLKAMLEKDPQRRCTWQYIFYVLLPRQNKFEGTAKISEVKNNQCFKVVEISDALLENLSKMDFQLYSSLKNESIMIIDHVEAEILSKRQVLFFCDRLYAGLNILNETKRVEIKLLKSFMCNLILHNYLESEEILFQFDQYYHKVESSDFIKLLTSKKYRCIRSLTQQDFQQLHELVTEIKLSKQTKSWVNSSLYKDCEDVFKLLLEMGQYQFAAYIYELHRWFEEREDCLLVNLRKNIFALNQFFVSVAGIQLNKLKNRIHGGFSLLIDDFS